MDVVGAGAGSGGVAYVLVAVELLGLALLARTGGANTVLIGDEEDVTDVDHEST